MTRILFGLLFLVSMPLFAQKEKLQQDSIKVKKLEEIVVSATRLPENAQKSPISIEILDAKAAKNSPAPSYFDAIENLKGVQVITPSLGFKVYNARGFTNPTNVRFVQLVDGVDNQAPHIGAPIAAALAPIDLDLKQVEMIPGVAAALYGLNALNGMVNIITQNPFDSPGLSFQQKTGLNHINDANAGPKLFSESSIRWAKKINAKLAFKVNGAYQSGYDWIADNHTDLNPTANASLNIKGGEFSNPAYDGINWYGDESTNSRTLSLGGKQVVVARTGYEEKQATDFSLKNWKVDGAMFYRPNGNTEWSYFVKFSNLDNIYQRTNRFRLQDYTLFQQGLTFKSPSVQIKAYMTHENTGHSYNIRSMAENIDKNFKSDNTWFADFSNQYNLSTKAGASMADALTTARNFADQGRPIPGTPAFKTLMNTLSNINNWDVGAALRVQTFMYNADGQIDLTKHIFGKNAKDIKVLSGFDYRNYVVIPDGNYFINPVEPNKNLTYYKYGGFLEIIKTLFNEKLKLEATLRADKNQYFNPVVNPRISLVYSPDALNNFRISYQSGYRFPSLFEAFSNVNSGGVKRVGGLKIMSNGIFENSYFASSISAFQAAVNNDVNQNGLTKTVAIQKNLNLLQKNNYTYLRPEHVKSLEMGYKAILFQNQLSIDADFYFSVYDGFIAQVNASTAKGNNPDSLGIYFSNKQYQNSYRLWTNSKARVYNYGASFGAKWFVGRNFVLGSNVSYAQLDRKDFGDGLEEAFNTPKWIFNGSFGIRRIIENLSFNTTFKWQNAYLWQSSLASGIVPAYHTLDAQFTYVLPKTKLEIKCGGTNILNQYYYNFLAGPSVGGFYYSSLKFEI